MILITGGSGFIGKAIAEAFDEDVVSIVRRGDSSGKGKCVQFDLTQTTKSNELVSQLGTYKITHIIHAAAVTPWAAEPDFSDDLKMAKTIAALTRELQIRCVYFVSGWNVYDMSGKPPFKEDTPLKPIGEYGKSKYEVEQYLSRSLKCRLVNLRLASVYGPGQTSPGLIPNLTKTAFQEHEIIVKSSTTKRDYLYIGDLVNAVCNILKLDLGDRANVNMGSGTSVTVASVAETIANICEQRYGFSVRIIDESDHNTQTVTPDNELDITKAQEKQLLHATQTPLRQGLELYIEWAKNENIF